MSRIVRPDPEDFEGHIALDMRVSPSTGDDLKAEINESISHSQLFIQTTLPDRLIVTQKQFKSLQDSLDKMYQTEDRMYVTPLNVMEVVIDREIAIDTDIEGVMVEVDKLKEEIHDHDADNGESNRPTDTLPDDSRK